MDFSEFLQPGIFGLTGKPGAGKSYFSTRVIIEEIKSQNRAIVTNVPLVKDKLREFVKKDFYVYQLETFTDNKHFFTHRGSYHMELPEGAIDDNVNFTELVKKEDEGILFVIDEAHLYFNSRNWKFMSQATLSYITFIRHLGDTLVWMCQSYGDIDKQFRGKTQAFHLLRNLNREKMGIFKRGTGFKCFQYLEEAHIEQRGKMGERCNQSFSYPFEMKYAECYNTSLFNKQHDKKYKVKGIPLKYPFGAVIILFLAFLFWIGSGGIWDAVGYVIPSYAEKKNASSFTEVFGGASEKAEKNETIVRVPSVGLPIIDPFEDLPTIGYEFPFQVFKRFNEPFGQVTEDEAVRLKQYFFGGKRYCVLTFITEKESSSKDFEISIEAMFNEYIRLQSVAFSYGSGIFEIKTQVFGGFLKYLRAKGKGNAIKTIRFILKENVPYTIRQGYEIPIRGSTALQGVVQTNYQFKQVGFSLNIVQQSIDGGDLVYVDIENKEVMDSTSDVPIMQNFESENIFDVTSGMTYEIADYVSTEQDESKGFLKKREFYRMLRNRVFLTYGQ